MGLVVVAQKQKNGVPAPRMLELKNNLPRLRDFFDDATAVRQFRSFADDVMGNLQIHTCSIPSCAPGAIRNAAVSGVAHERDNAGDLLSLAGIGSGRWSGGGGRGRWWMQWWCGVGGYAVGIRPT